MAVVERVGELVPNGNTVSPTCVLGTSSLSSIFPERWFCGLPLQIHSSDSTLPVVSIQAAQTQRLVWLRQLVRVATDLIGLETTGRDVSLALR